MNTLRHLVASAGGYYTKLPLTSLKTPALSMFSPKTISVCMPTLDTRRQLSTSIALMGDRDRKAENSQRRMMRTRDFDQSVNEVINLDTLAKVEVETEEVKDTFTTFPDETTSEQLFNGTAFKDLPYVTMVLHRNNTKLIARWVFITISIHRG